MPKCAGRSGINSEQLEDVIQLYIEREVSCMILCLNNGFDLVRIMSILRVMLNSTMFSLFVVDIPCAEVELIEKKKLPSAVEFQLIIKKKQNLYHYL